jgi:hypothetical protein
VNTSFSSDGFYEQMTIPAGRPKPAKPLADYTKEELLARFTRVEARRGRYTVSGTTPTYVATLNPKAAMHRPAIGLADVAGRSPVSAPASP